MTRLFLAFVLLLSLAVPAEAAIFKPKNAADCVKDNVAETNTDWAARLIFRACQTMFRQYTKDEYLNETYDLANIKLMPNPSKGQTEAYNIRTRQWDNNEGVRYTLLQTIKEKGLLNPQMSQEMLQLEVKFAKGFDAYVKDKRTRANCILELDELYDATNDYAAQAIYKNSPCQKKATDAR